MKSMQVTETTQSRRDIIGPVGGVLVGAGLAAFLAAVVDLTGLREGNLLLASGGAIGLGLVLVATSLFVRLRELHEARLLEAEFFLAEQELKEALELSERLRQRFEKRGIKRPAED